MTPYLYTNLKQLFLKERWNSAVVMSLTELHFSFLSCMKALSIPWFSIPLAYYKNTSSLPLSTRVPLRGTGTSWSSLNSQSLILQPNPIWVFQTSHIALLNRMALSSGAWQSSCTAETLPLCASVPAFLKQLPVTEPCSTYMKWHGTVTRRGLAFWFTTVDGQKFKFK